MEELIGLTLLAAVAGWWWTAMRVREQAIGAARRACRTFGVQLLDDSVVLDRIQPRCDEHGHWRLRRRYRFEFTQSGGERFVGYMTLLGRRVLAVDLDAADQASAPAHRHIE